MDRVRVMLWCTTCVPGVQLPLFAASAAGAFEDHGLEVEFVPPSPLRDMSLRGLSVRVDAVDGGAADFAVTAVGYLLAAQAAADGGLATRFVTTFHQHSPSAGIVPADCELVRPGQLAGRTAAGYGMPWMIDEYRAALAGRGLSPGATVEDVEGAYGSVSLLRGDVEVVPAWTDVIPTMHASSGGEFRAVPLGTEVYATGLLAAGRVPAGTVSRMTRALAEGTAIQRVDPRVGIEAYTERFPAAADEDLALAWSLYERNAPRPSSTPMTEGRWRASVDFYTRAYGLPALDLQQVCRPELLDRPTVPARVS